MKKSVISRNGSICSQLDEFLGRPPLLKGEDRVNYRKLRKSVAEVMDPENLLEAIEVQEVVDSIWEARRFQKLGTKLVDAECLKALKFLSSSMYGYITETAEDWLESLEGKPYPDGMTKADVLKKAG